MSQGPQGGFAAATPPQATTLHTDDNGLRTGDAVVTVAGQAVPVYFAAPHGVASPPIVLVVQEIFGVHEHIRDVTRRLAKLGYLAVAPELYVRQGDPRSIPTIDELREKIISKVPDQQVFDDLDACIDWAVAQGGDGARVGLTGFCWGGRIAWLYAARQPRLKAAVAWYGKLVGPTNALSPRHPVDVAIGLLAPVLGLYGEQDGGIPLDTVHQMQELLVTGGTPSHIVVYPGAGHAFFADYRPSYHAPSAQAAWSELEAWLARWL
ncbi:MAG: dienelactone hydrolase family protein [Rhodocyclaceae bacterium]